MNFTVTPGYTLQSGEEIENDKLNQGFNPNITLAGGIEATEFKLGQTGVVSSTDSGINSYVGTILDEVQDLSALVDGLWVAWEVPAAMTNTATSTFQLRKSDLTSLGTKTIQKRGRDLIAGDLIEKQWVTLRYESTANGGSGAWQLVNQAQIESEDICAGPYFVGTDDATTPSTATAYRMRFSPVPRFPAAGMRVRWNCPVTSGAGPSLQVLNAAGDAVGGAIAIRKMNRNGVAFGVVAGELVAGQWLELVYNGSYWLVTNYLGSEVIAIGTTPAVSNGLVVTNNSGTPNTQIDIDADELTVANAAGGSVRTLTAVNLTVNIAASGANGLDTGSPSSGVATWYFVYVIYDGTTTAGLLSTSATAPTLPSGYTYYNRVGAVRRTAADVFLRGTQYGRQAWLEPVEIFDTVAGVTSYTSQSVAAAVPSIARVVSGSIGKINGVTEGAIYAVAGNVNGLGEQVVYGVDSIDFGDWSSSAAFRVPLPSAQTIAWKTVFTTSTNRLAVTGYEI